MMMDLANQTISDIILNSFHVFWFEKQDVTEFHGDKC